MKTILITGASGFVGKNLVSYLKNKHTLWALNVKEQPCELYSKTFLWNDLYKIPFDEVDVIIHLAGKAHDLKNKSNAQSYFDINTGLTQVIFDKYMSSKAKKFIFFSSVKAAADYVEGDILTEDIIPHPVGPYGESKIKAEEYIQSKNWQDKKVYIFRPCMIHGPGNKGNLNLLYSVISKGIPYPLGAYDNLRSFTSIDNLCFIIDNIVVKDIESGIYNIADDEAISTNRLIEIISTTLGKKKRIYNFPKSLIHSFAKCGNVLHLPLNTFRLNKLTENYVVSNKKIKEAIEISALPTSTTDGIQKTIKSFNE